jgi:hypothetical protein
LAAVPALPGRTLVLVDRSGSMLTTRLSRRSNLTAADGAALFGTVLALRAEHVDLVEFGLSAQPVPVAAGDSALRVVAERFHNMGGTYTAKAVRERYRGHDRVVIVTDEQSAEAGTDGLIPVDVPPHTFNLAGYRYGNGPSGGRNRHIFGGLSDAAFRLIPLVEAGQDTEWPF